MTCTQWSLGHGDPQPEASVVKLDILETLLARYHRAGSALPTSGLPLARQMMEFSDNTAATTPGGPSQMTPAQRWGMSGGVPSVVTVALKNGWLPLDADDEDWQVNSVGWISGDGRDYLIAALTTGNATEQDGIDMIAELAGIVWRNMR